MRFLLLLLFLPLSAFSQFESKSFSVGARTSYAIHENREENTLVYYQMEYSREDLYESYTLKKNLSFRVFDFTNTDEHSLIDPYDISLEWLKGNFSFQVGFLRYRFSESFGVQLLDVANPRDYSEFIFNDLSWSKRAVFGANTSYKLYEITMELYLSLWPNGDRLSYKNSYYDKSGDLGYEGGVYDKAWFSDLEYGLRLSHIFKNSLSLSFLYYHHEHRPLTLKSVVDLTQVRLIPEYQMVDSYGSSFSYLISDYVLRGDLLYTHDDLFMYRNDKLNKDHFQSLIGIDKVFESINLGIQSFNDHTNEENFVGVRLESSLWDSFIPSFQYFYNLSSYDRWFEMKSEFIFENMTLSLIYDDIDGGDNSLFSPYKNNDRYLIDILFRY